MVESAKKRSAKAGGFRDLNVWHRASDIAVEIYSLTASFPDGERYGLASQMRRCSVSISSNIAEGYGRQTPLDFAKFLRISRGSAFELLSQVILATRLGYLRDADCCALETRINSVVAQLNGLIKFQSSRVEEESSVYEISDPHNSDEPSQ